MKVRVPSLEVAPGAEVKVTVTMSADPSTASPSWSGACHW
jgi:hypothetical protein